MKPFEELHSQWVDGALSGSELEAFEREFTARPEAEPTRDESRQLGLLLRRHVEAPGLTNPDFFCHQVKAQIEADDRRPAPVQKRQAVFPWSLANLGWAAVCCLLVAFAMYQSQVGQAGRTAVAEATPAVESSAIATPEQPRLAENTARSYDATIIKVEAAEPAISATPVYSAKGDVTVLWLDGLEYLPANYSLE